MKLNHLVEYPRRLIFRRGMARKVQMFGNAYLRRRGWHESFRTGACVDAQGAPLPWITYPATEMLARVARKQHRVFEYGSGMSSLWWASRVASVYSVEHDIEWAKKISKQAPTNLTITTRTMGELPTFDCDLATEFFKRNPDLPSTQNHAKDIEHGFNCLDFIAYAAEIAKFPPYTFDIVVVDGMARSLSAWMALHLLRPDGFIVFDNAERWQYNPAFDALSKAGFCRLDFHGPVPFDIYQSCTSIFTKSLDWACFNQLISEPSNIRQEQMSST